MMQHYAVQSVALSQAQGVDGYPISGHLNGNSDAGFLLSASYPRRAAKSQVTKQKDLVQSVDPERSPAPVGLPAASFDTAWPSRRSCRNNIRPSDILCNGSGLARASDK